MKFKSYEELLEEYLEDLPDDMDKREGTLVYIIGSALAMNLSELYHKMCEIEDGLYVDTATGEQLDNIAELFGMKRRDKTKAVVRMEGDMNFNVGDSVVNGTVRYDIISKEADYYLAECYNGGEGGNTFIGEVLPLRDREFFEGLNIVKIVAKGEEREGDDALRERITERLKCPICTGNLSYYKEVFNSITDVGGIKVFPVSEGVGTVKVVITDSNYEAASDDLVAYVKMVVDPEETSGLGYGLVPMGHKVTVESAQTVDLDIAVEVAGSLAAQWYYREANSALGEVLKELNKSWDKSERIVLLDRVIEDFFFSIGAEDVNIVSINGSPNRLILEENQILGGVNVHAP